MARSPHAATYRVEYNLHVSATDPTWSKNWHLAKMLTGANAEAAATKYMRSLALNSWTTARLRVVQVEPASAATSDEQPAAVAL